MFCFYFTDDGNHNESDVQILEPHISIMNLDEYDESKALSATLDESNIPVKIKEEPKYEGYNDPDEDDGFEDVGTFEADPIDLMDEQSRKFFLSFFFAQLLCLLSLSL